MRSLMYLMTMMAWIFSLTACSVDSDGNDYDAPVQDLIGTWDVVCSQCYEEGEGYGMPVPEIDCWVITANTITKCNRATGLRERSVGYTFDGRCLLIDGSSACEVVTLSRQLMLLRQKVDPDVFRETTFKRR